MMERITVQVEELEAWKVALVKSLRKAAAFLAFGLILFAAGGVWSTWRIFHLGQENRAALIAQNQFDNRLLQEQYRTDLVRWQACKDRNALQKETLRQDEFQLKMLIQAHKRDGNVNAARSWENYLKRGQQSKLPDCGPKPAPPEQEENVP